MLNQLSHRGTLSCFKKFSDLAWRFPSPLDREPGPSVRVTRIQTHAFLVHPDALGKWEWREYPGVSAPFESCLNDQVPLLRKPVRGWAAEEGWCPNRATRQLIPRLCCHTSPAPSLLCHKFDQQRVPSIAKPAPVQLRKMSCPTEGKMTVPPRCQPQACGFVVSGSPGSACCRRPGLAWGRHPPAECVLSLRWGS